MGKLVTMLATTTVLFAASTAYFAYRLSQANATQGVALSATEPFARRTDGSPAASAAVPARGSVATTSVPPGAVAADRSAAAPAAGGSNAETDANRAMMLSFAKDFLSQYNDPARRAAQLRAARGGVEAQYTRFRERYKIDARAFDQLVELLTADQLEQQASYFRCLVDPACDQSKLPAPRDHSDELLALLGADFPELRKYQATLTEWQSVVQLRGRLSESNFLRDSDAERLMKMLSDERERYVSQAAQTGANVVGWGNGSGTLWYSGDGGMEEQMASAAQYSERMRSQAASVLTPEQLRAFDQLQQEMLAGLESYLRSKNGKPG